MGIFWTTTTGFVASLIATSLLPGDNVPTGLALTTLFGVCAALAASCLGQGPGQYRSGEGSDLTGAAIGAILVLPAGGLASKPARHPHIVP